MYIYILYLGITFQTTHTFIWLSKYNCIACYNNGHTQKKKKKKPICLSLFSERSKKIRCWKKNKRERKDKPKNMLSHSCQKPLGEHTKKSTCETPAPNHRKHNT